MSLADSTPARIAKTTFSEFSENRCMQMAAALAYYTTFSIAPLMVIVIAVAGWVMQSSGTASSEEEVKTQIVSQIGSLVGEQPAEQIGTMVSASQTGGDSWMTTIVSIIVLLFGATAVVGQLQASMNQAWGVEPDPDQGGIGNFIRKRILSLAMILGVAFLLLVSLILNTALEAFNDYFSRYLPEAVASWVPRLSNFLIQLLITTGLFAAVFKVLPDVDIRWRDVGVGAFATALAFGIGRFVISIYLANSDVTNGFGAAGSLVLFLVWIYYSSLIFLLGVEFTQAYVRHQGRRIEPQKGAVRVTRKVEHDRSAAA